MASNAMKLARIHLYFTLVVLLPGMVGCDVDTRPSLFTSLDAAVTGVAFSNDLNIADSINILNYIYAFNGGGVAIGDLNNNGREDLVFAGNQVSSRVYLNQGDFKFQDITAESGLKTNGWCTGVSLVDINSDGFLDIYLSRAGAATANGRTNLLYINDGEGRFDEQAEAWGIADTSYTTHAAFFDYDRDGDLDLYLLNHANDRAILNTPLPKKRHGESPTTDKLYRNNGNQTFTDVSLQAGITIEGYGLGVSISDINNDGWPDIYVSNDFISNDLLYINNTDGTFSNMMAETIQEQSYNGMGNDVADINNDGWMDIMVMDMLLSNPVDEKMMAGAMSYDKFTAIRAMGYQDQFVRNTLQLNQGAMHFAEIGRFAGVHRTDWSWAPLFADYDNDGYKDLYITNGYLRDITNKDFIDYNNNLSMFKPIRQANQETLERIVDQTDLGAVNFVFKNNGDLTFSNATDDWTDGAVTFSNGVAYGDLDNDGDLDLVVNNINSPATLLRNGGRAASGYIQIQLSGPKDNAMGIGAKVKITSASGAQWQEQSIARGFMSSVSPLMHFGLGADPVVDSIEVRWPDGMYSRLGPVPGNQRLTIDYSSATPQTDTVAKGKVLPAFVDRTAELGMDVSHQSSGYPDFKEHPLFPYRRSTDGFHLASGDFNGDGRDDLFVHNGIHTIVYWQSADGSFTSAILERFQDREIVGVTSADVNGDATDDLLFLIRGTPMDQQVTVELWLGGAEGAFTDGYMLLPPLTSAISAMAVGDYDRDGDPDLLLSEDAGDFLQSRLKLLENNKGKFINVTHDLLPELPVHGIVKALTWADYTGDRQPDIIVMGEWMPPVFLASEAQGFRQDFPLPENTGWSGWWRSAIAADIDADGDVDLVAGNRGLNAGYTVTATEPSELNWMDMDTDQAPAALMTYYVNGTKTLQPARETLIRRYPFLARLFPNHMSYAATDPDRLIEQSNLRTSLAVHNSASYFFENVDGAFVPHLLPPAAQLFPIGDMVADDFYGDGQQQVLITGGFSMAEPDGRSYGRAHPVIATVDGQTGSFVTSTAFYAQGDVVSLATLQCRGVGLVAVAIREHGLRIIQYCPDKKCNWQ